MSISPQRRPRGLRMLEVTLVALALVLSVGNPVGAIVAECTFDEPSATVTVTPTDFAAVIAVDGEAIAVDGVACGAATVTTTDTIDVDALGGDDVTISLAGGAFAPGAAEEPDGTNEIEFVFSPTNADLTVLGSDGPDEITGWFEIASGIATATAFTTFLSLTPGQTAEDPDVTMLDGYPGLTTVLLGAGDDRFLGTRAGLVPYIGSLFVQGGEGDDVVAPGAAADDDSFVFGGPGLDTLTFGPHDASCIGFYVQGGGHVCDHSFSGGVFEQLRGHAGPDWLGGDVRLDEASGRGGDDVLFAGPGDGVLDGGQGRDMAAFTELLVPRGVRVDLREGTAHGRGDDLLTSIEDVVGTGFGDVLVGDARDNLLSGDAGDDELLGRGGIDSLDGGVDSDLCDTGPPGGGETVKNCEG